MRASLLLSFLLLSSCVGGTFGNTSEFEEYPLRSASEEESGRLKKCLRSAHRLQLEHKQKSGAFYKKAREIPLDSECDGFFLTQKKSEKGFEIMAQFHENESTVRWVINQDGVIEELLDPEYDEDLQF